MNNRNPYTLILTTLCLGVAFVLLTAPSAAAAEAALTEAALTEAVLCEAAPEAASTAAFPCREVCSCQERQTSTFTRVGANCSKAQQNALNAALAAAVCNPGETPCGSQTYWISSCSQNHLGQTQASAFVEYSCEVCVEICCGPSDCDPENGCVRGCPA